MALKKYDARRDALVMETRTLWDPEIASQLSDDDKGWLAEAVHAAPEIAEQVEYDRSHTGFTRIITVTVGDIARLSHQRAPG